jgi:hypothetical protein
MRKNQDAPACGQGVGDLMLGGSLISHEPISRTGQIQVLSHRLGLSEPLASVVLSLLRGEQHSHV